MGGTGGSNGQRRSVGRSPRNPSLKTGGRGTKVVVAHVGGRGGVDRSFEGKKADFLEWCDTLYATPHGGMPHGDEAASYTGGNGLLDRSGYSMKSSIDGASHRGAGVRSQSGVGGSSASPHNLHGPHGPRSPHHPNQRGKGGKAAGGGGARPSPRAARLANASHSTSTGAGKGAAKTAKTAKTDSNDKQQQQQQQQRHSLTSMSSHASAAAAHTSLQLCHNTHRRPFLATLPGGASRAAPDPTQGHLLEHNEYGFVSNNHKLSLEEEEAAANGAAQRIDSGPFGSGKGWHGMSFEQRLRMPLGAIWASKDKVNRFDGNTQEYTGGRILSLSLLLVSIAFSSAPL